MSMPKAIKRLIIINLFAFLLLLAWHNFYKPLIPQVADSTMSAQPDRPEFHEQMLQINPVYIVPKYDEPEIPPEWRRPGN